MAEHEDTSAALRRLEAALNRIAAHVAKPRSAPAVLAGTDQDGMQPHPLDKPTHQEIVTRIDDLISGLRNALGNERQP